MIKHIVPQNDDQEHVISSTCKCGPRVEIIGMGHVMVSHHAYDNREVLERVSDILGVAVKGSKLWATVVEDDRP